MAANRTASRVHARPTTKPIDLDTPAIDYTTDLIYQICCFAGSFDLINEFRDQKLCAAIEQRDNAALFDRLMVDFSFQGISNEIAANYMRRHGHATWHAVRKNLAGGVFQAGLSRAGRVKGLECDRTR